MSQLSFDALVALLKREDLLLQAPAEMVRFTALCSDSRRADPGSMFIAVRGVESDGHHFVPDAARQGAVLAVVEVPTGAGIPEIVVRDARRAALAIGRWWFGDPGRRLTLIGVTGTNGKTTTTALVRHLLNQEETVGSIGTLGAFDGAGALVPSTAGTLTTPGPIDLQATLATLAGRGARAVVMETSSHSLDQGRLDGLTFAAGIFTNLTRDHLDYHGTFEAYLAAKLRLDGLLGNQGVQVVNRDDSHWEALPAGRRRITFGLTGTPDVGASGLSMGHAGSRFRLGTPAGAVWVELPLLGEFNVANALAAAACAVALGVPLERIAERLSHAPQVPGRMEQIATDPAVVLRDYAHTPDALERALQALRPLTPGRLIVVFGCGGERDRGKRPLMGRIAATLADLAVVTSDNPRTEDPERIIDEVEQGMIGHQHARRADRREAIAVALANAAAGDTVLLTGKGHEDYQVIGRDKVPFDERTIVREILDR